MNDNVVTEAVLACVRFGNRPLTDARAVTAMIGIRNNLATIFSTIARGIASNPRYSGWKIDEANPGYLLIPFQSFVVRAPWNVVADFPDNNQLKELLTLASAVKYQGDTVVCLSGSVLSRAAVPAVSDIDLCEYVSAEGIRFSDIAKQALSGSGSDVVCVAASAYVTDAPESDVDQIRAERPWDEASTGAFLRRVEDAVTGKCDFAVRSRSEGIIEMTNIVLRVDARYPDTEDAWSLSFPYQEAAVGSGSWVPRRLASPSAIGRYVVWLFRQVEAHSRSLPAKAAKRGLSLARILGSSRLAGLAQRALQEDQVAVKAVLEARIRFYDRLVGMSDPATEPFSIELEATIRGLAKAIGFNGGDPSAGSEHGARVGKFEKMADSLRKSMPDIADLDMLEREFRVLLEPAIQKGRY